MSLFRRHATITPPQDLIPSREGRRPGHITVTGDTAMRHSAVWACLRLRADLLSTMPVDVYRRVQGVQVEVPKPPVLVNPGGERVDLPEWMYSTQVDLDRAGNCFGVISERSAVLGTNGLGLPARIDLVSLSDVIVRARGSVITEIRIAGERYTGDRLADVWHEKQFTRAGLPLGLSPVAYAAGAIEESLSAQQFALDWFGASAIPAAELKNTEKVVPPEAAVEIKERYRATVTSGDVFVHGKDWEYKPIQAVAAQSEFLESRRFGLTEISRFLGCPADVIDAAVSTGSITYASITQRNLQLLIMNLGPAVTRRETALGRLTPGPRYVKLNRSSLLAMDPEARARTLEIQIRSRQIAPSEARAIDDRPPYTEAQLSEFDRHFGSPRNQPTEAKA